MKTKSILFATLLVSGAAASLVTSCEKGNGNNNPDLGKTGNLTFNDGIELVFVEGGTYTQGSDGIIKPDEKPAHQVTLSDFYIGKYEVTQKQYYDVVGH
ncbi:MAG: formylglycine-generating enzyme family protein, partial [Prevotellaceae bacterium]|nr:formylglycine-generating enzyme family protein [Prevotellaceae bacterium]